MRLPIFLRSKDNHCTAKALLTINNISIWKCRLFNMYAYLPKYTSK